jgi:hypothetical protein
MYALRCTRSLLDRFRKASIEEIPSPAPATTALGDWYANGLNIGRHRLVLCVNERSLLPVVIAARDLPDLPRRLAESVGGVLAALGVRHELIRAEIREMQWIQVARTQSRSVLGSMNDFAFAADAYFRSDREVVSLPDLNLWLADTPCKPLQYERPAEVAVELMRAAS